MVLYHHQISTYRENVKFREKTVDLLPGTLKVVTQETAAVAITHCSAFTDEIHMF